MLKTKFLATALLGLALATGTAHAAQFVEVTGPSETKLGNVLSGSSQAHAYRASISGPADCTMPTDFANPGKNPCTITLGAFETGHWVVKNGDTCSEVTTTLVKMESLTWGEDKTVDFPSLDTTVTPTDCPTPT